MKALQKTSKFLSDYTSIVVIAIAVVTFFLPSMMGWVNLALFTDMVSNKFTCQSIIIGIIMFSMGLTLTTEDFKILAQRPFDICVGAVAQYLIMPFLAFALSKVLNLPDGIALGLILVGCCPGGVSSNIMSYLCGGDVAFSVGMTTVSTLVSPVMTPLMVSLLASGTQITIKGLPMFVSIIETVILPVGVGFLLNYLLGKNKTFRELQKVMPGVAVLGLACVVGGVVSSQGAKFFQSGVVIFVAVLLHNGLGYLLGYGAGKLVGMNTSKKRTISIEVGMQNAGLATNLATTTAQFASTPESAIICAVSCTWHSISGTLLGKPLDGDDCLVVFINRISMLHQNSYGFLDSIHVFYIRNFAIFIFYRTQLRNLRRMSLIVLLVIFQTVGCCLETLRTKTEIALFFCLLLAHFDFSQFAVFLGCLYFCLRRTVK